jgi:hypothetical protein
LIEKVRNLFQSATGDLYSYPEYLDLIAKIVEHQKTTGPKQTPELAEYTRLNFNRMLELNKTVSLNRAILDKLAEIKTPQNWYILTEGWCGDAAQNIPVWNLMAEANPTISLKLLLRDENPMIMDAYLTNGGRSIPKLIALDEQNNELFTWGPRPVGAQQLMDDYKANPVGSFMDFIKSIYQWYVDDNTKSVQQEILTILEGVFAGK